MSIERISSRKNPLVRRFRDVAAGEVEDAMLLDGEHLLEEALASGLPIEVAAFTEQLSKAASVVERLAASTKIVLVSDSVLKAISPVQSPSGAVAIAGRPQADLERVFAREPQLVLFLHNVQDPGNVGAIMRAAEGCGATGVVCNERTADPFGWKALRGSMGSSFRLPLVSHQNLSDAIGHARDRGLRLLATTARGGTPLADCNLRMPAAILIGGEGGGLPPGLIDAADESVTIPMQPPVESLNVSIAAALVIYEAARQRRDNRRHVAL